ncbi:MAG: putative toxin-antitoxin system toxin component, PIN family [Deltaproteobacteria bacterium]|nr:putative toxin-antitoxin system toxin component, PIN family [Deltaproteobacteria bacterium]
MQKWIRVYKATLDTNIFLRALIRKENICDKVVQRWKEDDFILVPSEMILAEIRDVLSRPFLITKYGYSPAEVEQLVDLIRQRGVIINPTFSFSFCRDVTDDKFVDCAIFGRVHFLVSGDNDFLEDANLKRILWEYGVKVVDIFEFYQKLQEEFSIEMNGAN